jgi:glycosyltransferase involved in cell wall biosynthesis
MRNKVLFICSHIPSPFARQAGHKVAYSNLLNLSKDYDVDLFIVGSSNLDIMSNEYHQLSKITISITHVPISKSHKLFGLLFGFFLGFAPRFSTRLSILAIKECKEFISKFNYEFIWLEWSQSFWIANFLPKDISIVMALQDLQVTLVSTKSKIESIFFLGLTFLTEKKLLNKADKIVVLTNSEKLILTNFYKFNSDKIVVFNPPISDFIKSINRNNKTVEPHSLLFWGAMSRPENYRAAQNFLYQQFPIILKVFPNAKVYVVGSDPPDSLLRLASNSIFITGFVEDPTEYFELASVGIAPLSEGAGIKLKVLEMLSAGMPVIASPIGAEGIKNSSNLSICECKNFAEFICNLWLSQVAE